MPRDRANLRIDMWGDADWRNLTMPAQHLYQLILTHSSLNYAGVGDWRPVRLAPLTKGNTVESIETAAKELQASAFIYVDEDTEEVLIRSFLKHDGLMSHNKLPLSMVKDFNTISSPRIQEYIVHELRKLNTAEPDLAAWRMKAVMGLLKRTARDLQADLRDRLEEDSSPGLGQGSGQGVALDQAWIRPKPGQGVALGQGLPTATATSTATPPTHVGGSRGGLRADLADEIDPFATDPEPITPEPIRPEPDMFTQFWNAYPRKAGRVAALKAWTLAVQQGTPETTILAGAARYAADPNRVAQFTKNPANWLSAGDWDADPLPARLATNGTAAERRNAEWAAAYAELQNEPIEYLEFPETQEGIK